jgi:hypothetical protein
MPVPVLVPVPVQGAVFQLAMLALTVPPKSAVKLVLVLVMMLVYPMVLVWRSHLPQTAWKLVLVLVLVLVAIQARVLA